MWIPWTFFPFLPVPRMYLWERLATGKTQSVVRLSHQMSHLLQSCHPLAESHSGPNLQGEPFQINDRQLPRERLPNLQGSTQCLPRDKRKAARIYSFLSLRWYHKGMSRAAACLLSPLCKTSNRRSGGGRARGWLTRPAGWTQPVQARLGSPAPEWVALRQLSRPQLPPRALTWHGIWVMLLGLSFGGFFGSSLSPAKQWWGIAGWPASHVGAIALHCYTPGCTMSEVLRRLRVLIWVIKFSSINATGVPLYEIIPSL